MDTIILVVDSNRFVCSSVAQLCRSNIEKVWVETARNLDVAVASCRRFPPSIVIIDPRFFTSTAGELFELFLRSLRGAKLLVFGDRLDELTLLRVSRVGVSGYVLKKECPTPQLGAIIARVMLGERVFHPVVTQASRALMADQGVFYRVLSDRELELMPYLGAGVTNDELSSLSRRSVKTINNQRHSIMRKLNLHTTAELMRMAFRLGFVYLDSSGILRCSSRWASRFNTQLEFGWDT